MGARVSQSKLDAEIHIDMHTAGDYEIYEKSIEKTLQRQRINDAGNGRY